MRRHASLDELADLDAGVLQPRRVAKISEHVAGCSECTQLATRLSAVPELLSGIQYPSIPEHLSDRISGALATEASTRLAEQAPTEAGRRDLPARPERHRRRDDRKGWQLPGMPPLVSKLVTGAGALAILAGGGYAVAAGIGSGSSPPASSSSSGSASGGAAQTVGPRVSYGHSSSERSIQTVTSDENFARATLAVQAEAAVRKARQEGVHSGPAAGNQTQPDHATSTSGGNLNLPAGVNLSKSQVRACVDAVAVGRTVILIEFAKFEGSAATIIVAAADGSRPAHVWVVAPTCSAGNTDVLAQQTIGHV